MDFSEKYTRYFKRQISHSRGGGGGGVEGREEREGEGWFGFLKKILPH